MGRTTAPFILGMENTRQYQAESAFIRRAVRVDDLARMREIIGRAAQGCLGEVRAKGSLDAVGQYSRLLPLRLLEEFFGVPGPDVAAMMRCIHTIFWDIFFNFTAKRA